MLTAIRAQSPPPGGDLVLRANARVVEIEVSVRGPKGKPVADLDKDDFVITDDGKPRPFTTFSVSRWTPDRAHAVPATSPAEQLPPGTFTNLGPSGRLSEPHATVFLLDTINGWFDDFSLGRNGLLNARQNPGG